MKIWNYNKSVEDTQRGVQYISITQDINLITESKGVYLRKAPGIDYIDFGQEIHFPLGKVKNYDTVDLSKKCESVDIDQYYFVGASPYGYTLKILLKSTWGDAHYIGLNGLAVYNEKGENLLDELAGSYRRKNLTITADPSSIGVLPGMDKDTRVVENLYDGKNFTDNSNNIWLAPFVNPLAAHKFN